MKKTAICTKRLAPCRNICPASEDIQRWISLVKDQEFRKAWEVIIQRNPFPAICGRICYHYCETRCNRTQYDETVNIHVMERFLGDMAIEENWSVPVGKEKIGKKVLVVGAGPAGLSAAYYLRLLGVDVTIYEALPQAGGMMLTGIPAYRLPREILSKSIERLLNTGIKIEYNRKVEDLLLEKEQGGFDAVFLAIGAHLGKSVSVKMENSCLVTDAVEYLNQVAFNKTPKLGQRLVVYGGGNTAIDVARSAKRLGVGDVTIVYHRSKEKMPAFSHEVEDAEVEGIKFNFLRSITEVHGNTLSLSVNELDENGRPAQTGKIEVIETDSLIFALSQISDSEFLRKISEIDIQSNGIITVDDSFMTGLRGVFAGGDMIPYDRSVTVAIGHGRKAASHIYAYLNDTVFRDAGRLEDATFERLHINDEKSKKVKQKTVDPNASVKSFKEVVEGLDKDEVLRESQRCFFCGNCFGCGKCYAVCPVEAISHSDLDGRVTNIDVEKCIGCGKCFKVCPCGAINMVDR